MSTGTTMRLFLQDKSKPLAAELYDLYLKAVERYNDVGWSEKKKPLEYPRYLHLDYLHEDSDSKKNVDQTLWIYNVNDDYSKKPEPADLFIVQCIGETDFISDFTVLVEKWGMDAYSVSRSEHILTKDEIMQLDAVLNYLGSDLKYSKDAKSFERIIFENNEFFRDFNETFPSRYASRSYAKDQDGEFFEEENYRTACCQRISTFLKFYLEVSDDWTFKDKEYKLVYFKW